MKTIRLRTKIEVAFALLLLISVSVASVISLTRTISDSHDDIDTYIRNSNGNYWEATGSNLQLAINDIGNDGGTVWVGSDVTLSSEITIHNNDHLILDFQGKQVTLDDDISFINVTATKYTTIRDAKVLITSGHTESIIKLYNAPYAQWADRIRYNTIENIQIANPSSTYKDYTGIHIYVGTSNMLGNTFENIRMWGCKIGIHLECPGPNGWFNGGHFENIYIDQYETGIWFDTVGPSKGFNQNVFSDIKMQTADYSKDGFKDINGAQNHFYGCLVWDWYAATAGNHDWSISSEAYGTYICAHYIADILDDGSDTTIV